MDRHRQIEASRATVEDDVRIGAGSVVRGDSIVLRRGARIGDHVDITCDDLELGPDCVIGDNSTIVCPSIRLGVGCAVAPGLHAELNQHLHLERFCLIGEGIGMVGQGVSCGEFVFLDRGIIIGGGGARGPRSFLTIGGRTSIFAESCINLSEEVRIGHSVGISYSVALLTHNAWQPILKGYTARFAPITIEDNATIYLNVIILPGVTLGAWSTVGAGSIVTKDVPAHCLAVGNPARVVKGPEGYPVPPNTREQDSLIRAILADYLTNMGPKGVKIIEDSLASRDRATLELDNKQETIGYIAHTGHADWGSKPDITLAVEPVPVEFRGPCHLDLGKETMTGEPTRIAEDLRDYLRRRGIRVFTERPFQSLPLVNLQRLQRRREHDRQRRKGG